MQVLTQRLYVPNTGYVHFIVTWWEVWHRLVHTSLDQTHRLIQWILCVQATQYKTQPSYPGLLSYLQCLSAPQNQQGCHFLGDCVKDIMGYIW